MRTAVVTMILAGLMLNAGALASDNRAYLRAKVKEANITVVTKNQLWPPPHAVTLEPCSRTGCFDA